MTKRIRRRLSNAVVSVAVLGACGGMMAVVPSAGAAGSHRLNVGPTASSQVTCSKYISSHTFFSVAVGRCLPHAGHAYSEATGSASVLGFGPSGQDAGTLTWTGGATTTIGPATYTQVLNDLSCPLTQPHKFFLSAEQTESASVTAASTVGPGIPAVGDQVSATFCYYFKINHYLQEQFAILLPDTTLQL